MPFLVGIGFFCYLKYYKPVKEMIGNNQYNIHFLLMNGLVVFCLFGLPALVIGLLFRWSRIHHGYMLWVNQRQTLGRMIVDNRYFLAESKTKNGNSGKKAKITYFPRIYYQRKDGLIWVRFPLDLSNFQKRFLEKGKEIEQSFKMDLMETNREVGFICFKFLADVRLNRLNIQDMVIKNGKIPLMKNIDWDIDGVPHGLIVGGTGGGKTFFIFSLLYAILQMGNVDVCDPKQSDLKRLKDIPVFEGHIFYGNGIKNKILATEQFMKDRFAYMEAQGIQTLGNYKEYGLKLYFLVVDEWASYYDSLEKDVKTLREVMSALTQITLLGRQCGVFLILGMQRPDQKYFEGGLRDNLGLRVSLGKLSRIGYDMLYAGATNDKDYYNTKEKGRGYIDPGTSQVGEFYAPFIDSEVFNVFEEFGKFPKQEFPELIRPKEKETESSY
ncbi:FtsK/SpoIIIE domain-containing protein [Melissococcus plutonius]|nr:FtsK/SpoIIIE domain-containing protein [Melissococcus plutonius]